MTEKFFLNLRLSFLITIVTSTVGRDFSFFDDQETCELLSFSFHVIKEDYDELENVFRVCEDDILIKKCEGTCFSSLQPSVIHRSGFLKVSLLFDFL